MHDALYRFENRISSCAPFGLAAGDWAAGIVLTTWAIYTLQKRLSE